MHPPRPMRIDARPAVVALGVLLMIALAAGDPGEEPGPDHSGWDRLASLPRSRREELAANLKRFDELPGPEKQAVLEIDRRIAACATPPTVPAIWPPCSATISGSAASPTPSARPSQRPTRATAWPRSRCCTRPAARSTAESGRRPGSRPANLIQVEPIQVLAHQIKIWQALPPSRRKEVTKSPKTTERLKALMAEAEI